MAYKLFDALNRAVTTSRGAPDPRGISPQMQKNLDRRDARVRFREFRRTQGRPGVTGPFGFVAGRTAPIPPQIAAGRISSRLGTPFGSELNRLTAPDPMTFARGARAPEFADIDVRTGAAGARLGEAEAGTLEARLPFVAPREQADIAAVTGAETRAGAGEARLPTPEELAEDRGIARSRAGVELEQVEREDQLEAMYEHIKALELDGDYEGAEQVRQQIDALLGGAPAPDRTPPGGAPPLQVSPRAIERSAERALSLGGAAGLFGEEGTLKALEDVSGEQGFPTRDTLGNIEIALSSISEALANAPDTGPSPTPRDIIITKIKTSKGYRALKQRAEGGFGRTMTGLLTPFAGPRMLMGNLRPQDLKETQRLAQQIVDLVEQSGQGFGASHTMHGLTISYFHNEYLQNIFSLGIIGFACYCSVLWVGSK